MKDKIIIWIAWHLPRSIARWGMIRIFAFAGATEELSRKQMGELTVFDALKAWDEQYE